MKKMNYFRQATITATLLLVAVFVSAQSINWIINTYDTTKNYDTAKVVLLVGDTAHVIYKYMELFSCEEVGCKDTTLNHKKYVSHFKEISEDKGNYGSGQNYWVYGFEVRRKQCCISGGNENIDYYNPVPYYTRWLYLDDKKQPLKSTVIVWQSVPAK